MNEPPIASPFGEASSSSARQDKAALLLLKIIIGANVGAQSLLALFNLSLIARDSLRSQIFNANLASLTGLVLIVVVAIALLQGYKLFWWLFEIGFMLGAYDSISSFTSAPMHPKKLWVLPLPVEAGFFILRLILFIYLLTPAMRQFFFARPKTN